MKNAFDLTQNLFDRYGFPVLATLVVTFFILQLKYPLRKRVQPLWTRLKTNILMSLPAFGMLRLLFIPLMVWLALENQSSWHFGLNYLFEIPFWIEAIIAILVLDWAIYGWHYLTHKVPVLWRFHLVHHTDLDLDLITAFRFHFGELLLSAIFRGASVVLTGASPVTVLVYEVIFEICTNFHHSNWKLPVRVERTINVLFVTPRMHGIHHSIVQSERDSNWGTVFSFWDRIHRTLFLAKPQYEVVIGEAPYQDPTELTAGKLLLLPFRKIKRNRPEKRSVKD